MKKAHYSKILIRTILLTLVGLPLAANAQDSAGANTAESYDLLIEEITVTARRREESLQEVPVSISAFNTAMLEALNIRNVGDVAPYTPNLTRSSGPTGHNDGFYFIRGVGNTDLNPATDPGVATYLDGVYMGRITGASMDILNIERVEVLRGPQGTLFGRNTIGGAINVVTRQPSGELGYNFRTTVGQDGRWDYGGSVDVPLGEDFGVIVSYLHQQHDGWGKNVYTGEDFGTIDNGALNARFVWKPSDTFSASLGLDYAHQGGTSAHTILNGFNPFAVSPLGVPIPPDLGQDVSSDVYDNFHSVNPEHHGTVEGANLTLEWNFGGATLKSISAYRKLNQFAANDFDASGYVFYDHNFETDQHQFSQELQLLGDSFEDRLHWVLGAYYYDEWAYHNNRIAMGGNNGVPPGIPGVPYATRNVQRAIYNNQAFDIDEKAWALFAHMIYDFTDKLSGELGLRYTDEEKTQSYAFFIDNSANVFNFAGIPPFPYIPTLNPDNPFLTIPTTYSKSWHDTSPKLGLNYQATDNAMVYVSYAEGFRSGGFNGRPTPNQMGQFGAVQPYNPEYIDTYEFGWKTENDAHSFRLNGAVFYSAYKDIQLLVLGPSGFFETTNAAESHIKGAELEFQANPIEGLLLNAGIGFLDNKYTKLDPGTIAGGILPTNVLPNAPRWTDNIGAQYRFGLSNGSGIVLRADYIWQDDVYFNASNRPGEFQASYGLLNLRASWLSADERWEFAAYGLNVTDKAYHTNGQDIVGPLGVSFAGIGAPIELGVQLMYRSK